VLVERRGNAMVITINRPEARNAVNGAVSVGVGDALEEAQHDPDVRAVVITGAGDKSFCAGADLKAISRREKPVSPRPPRLGLRGLRAPLHRQAHHRGGQRHRAGRRHRAGAGQRPGGGRRARSVRAARGQNVD